MLKDILMKVNNLPANYEDYKYLTVRECDGEWWFYGAWRTDFDAALRQAIEIGGQLMPSAGVQPA